MTDSTPQAPQLDARLEEIGRKLREIQSELAPEVDAGATTDPLAAEQPPADGSIGAKVDAQLERLAALHTSLLSSMTDVLGQLYAVLGQSSRRPEAIVSAGPFTTIEALRRFEHELAQLPGVREVAVRGYEGEDRALIDVQLSRPTI